MTTFREFLGDLIKDYFLTPRVSHATQIAAATWEREPAPRSPLPRNLNLATLPGYHAGQYAQRWHNALEHAIQQATTPDLTKLPTLKPAPQHNPITPLPETITLQRESTPSSVDKSLILWTSIDDEDATEMRPAIRLKANNTKDTKDLPALEKLSWFLQAPISPHDTGEQEPVKINEDAFLL